MKILIVDNEPDSTRLFEQRLRKECREGLIELHFTVTAEEALAYLEQEFTAGLIVIMSDFDIVHYSEMEFLAIIRKKYPALKIFKVSAYDDMELCRQALASGADDCLSKPIDFQLLKQKLFL